MNDDVTLSNVIVPEKNVTTQLAGNDMKQQVGEIVTALHSFVAHLRSRITD